MAAAETYIFYLDLFFLTNLYFDFLSLSMAALMGRRPLRPGRLFLASALGSASACFFALFPAKTAAGAVLAAVFAESAMTAAAFLPKRAGELLHLDVLLFLAMAAAGGGFLFFKRTLGLSDPSCMLLLAAFAAAAGLFFARPQTERERGARRYRVRLYAQGASREFRALADSGNRLREPYFGRPVSIAYGGDLKELTAGASGFFCIPFRSVGRKRGMLAGYLFEKMEIVTESGVRVIEKPVVAAADEPLTADGDFSLLLPEALLFSSAASAEKR